MLQAEWMPYSCIPQYSRPMSLKFRSMMDNNVGVVSWEVLWNPCRKFQNYTPLKVVAFFIPPNIHVVAIINHNCVITIVSVAVWSAQKHTYWNLRKFCQAFIFHPFSICNFLLVCVSSTMKVRKQVHSLIYLSRWWIKQEHFFN